MRFTSLQIFPILFFIQLIVFMYAHKMGVFYSLLHIFAVTRLFHVYMCTDVYRVRGVLKCNVIFYRSKITLQIAPLGGKYTCVHIYT